MRVYVETRSATFVYLVPRGGSAASSRTCVAAAQVDPAKCLTYVITPHVDGFLCGEGGAVSKRRAGGAAESLA